MPTQRPSPEYSRTGHDHGSGGRDFGSSGSRDFGRGAAMNDRDPYKHGEAPGYRGERGQSGSQAGGFEQPRHGGHRGKGPIGYRGDDTRVHDEVCHALTHDDDIDACAIEVAVDGGEVTLTGTVPDRRTKRLAEQCVEFVAGVRDVHNHLRVK